jgi:dTDP-4-dehydrorhamnose reductase
MKRLILGDGLLGAEIRKQTGWPAISRKQHNIDFRYLETYARYLEEYDEVINCIAYCNTYDKERQIHWDVNYKGLVQLVDHIAATKKKLIHISTDYVYSNSVSQASENDVPVHCANWYGYTKLIGDAYVQLTLNDFLLLRGTHKPKPFMYDKAYLNQIGNFDYVDRLAQIMIELIENNVYGLYNVGTELKTMLDLAKQTKPNVGISIERFNETMPGDVSLDLTKLQKIIEV